MSNYYKRHDLPVVLANRLSLIYLPTDLKSEVARQILLWDKSNNPEYVVKRLKFVKQVIINYLTQDLLPPKDDNLDVWFKRNSEGHLYGVWGRLTKLSKTRPKAVAKLFQAFTAYKYDLQEPTSEMKLAFKETLEAPFTGDEAKLTVLIRRLRRNARQIISHYVPDKMGDVRVPGNYLLHARANNEQQLENLVDEATKFCHSDFGSEILRKYPVLSTRAFGQRPDVRSRQPLELTFNNLSKPYFIGRINWIWEPGLKERIVCDYVKPLEHLTKPMGDRLYSIIRNVPWDSTYHEEEGYRTIQAFLRQNKGKVRRYAYCFDLSSATDRFPWALQHAVLSSLNFGKNWRMQLDIYTKSIQQPVLLQDGVTTSHYAVGQPMGSYPSFAAFSLTHGMILMDYLHSRGIAYSGQFIVHGDDLVIMDDELAEYYKQFLTISGVKCNSFKTIISSRYAEFNSRLITKDQIIRMPKWKEVHLGNLMDHVQTWGLGLVDITIPGKKKRQQIKHILSIPGILPNGDSLNPEGKSIDQRLSEFGEEFLEFLNSKSNPESNYVSHRDKVIVRAQYAHKHFDSTREALFYQHLLLGALCEADRLDKAMIEDFAPLFEFMVLNDSSVRKLIRWSPLSKRSDAQLLGNVNVLLSLAANYTQQLKDTFVSDYPLLRKIHWGPHDNLGYLEKFARLHPITYSSFRKDGESWRLNHEAIKGSGTILQKYSRATRTQIRLDKLLKHLNKSRACVRERVSL